jgi:hypothetical protein
MSNPVSIKRIERTPIKPKVEIKVSGLRELMSDSIS